jgi:hypothetical protein
MNLEENQRVDLVATLRRRGFDVVIPAFGLCSYAAVYCRDDGRIPEVARASAEKVSEPELGEGFAYERLLLPGIPLKDKVEMIWLAVVALKDDSIVSLCVPAPIGWA